MSRVGLSNDVAWWGDKRMLEVLTGVKTRRDVGLAWRRPASSGLCIVLLCGSCTTLTRPDSGTEGTMSATPVASLSAQLSSAVIHTPQSSPAEQSQRHLLSDGSREMPPQPECVDTKLFRLTHVMASASAEEAKSAIRQAGRGGVKLAIPWMLNALQTDGNDSTAVFALSDLRSRNLLPAIMATLPRERRTEYRDEVSRALEGDAGYSKAILGLGTNWEAWWFWHGAAYWQKDFRDWSDTGSLSAAWRMVPVYERRTKPGEIGCLYRVPGSRYMYLGGYRPRLIRFDMQTGELVLADDPRPWYLALSPKESALHPGFASIHEVGDEVWGAFGRPLGIAALDGHLRLLRYHGTDREAIETEYDRIVRFRGQAPIWPVDDRGRVWNYVESAQAIRTYNGRRWEVLDLRPFVARTAALLSYLRCPSEGIAAYKREYVDVKWVHQIADGTICVGTSEGLLTYREGRWRHLNALDNCLLACSRLSFAGEGQPGQWWVACWDSTNLYGLVCVQGAGEAMDSFSGWPSARVPNEVLGDTSGRTWFEGGFLGTPSVMTAWTGSEWLMYPELPEGGVGTPSMSVVAPDGTVWFCNGALVGHISRKDCEAVAAPGDKLIGLAVDAQGGVHLATNAGIWFLDDSLWRLEASWR
jgi:hypothetical protein